MIQKDFENLQREIFKQCHALTITKGRDYTRGAEDVLTNFKSTAASFGMTPMQVCGIYLKKHVDALFTYIKTNGESESEPIDTRVQDAVNYIMFLMALIKEKRAARAAEPAPDGTAASAENL